MVKVTNGSLHSINIITEVNVAENLLKCCDVSQLPDIANNGNLCLSNYFKNCAVPLLLIISDVVVLTTVSETEILV